MLLLARVAQSTLFALFATISALLLAGCSANSEQPAMNAAAPIPYRPHDQYAIVWGGGPKPADGPLALKQFEKDFELFRGRFQGVEGFPIVLRGGRVKGLDTDNYVALLGYCNDEQVKASIAFYQSFHPDAYAKKVWSDWDNDRCPYPTDFDKLKAGPRIKAGKMTFNIVAYGPMTVAFLWNSKDELIQSKELEVAEESDLAQDIGCQLSLDPEEPNIVRADCESRRTHTSGIATLLGHFKVSVGGERLHIKWIQDKKVMDTGD